MRLFRFARLARLASFASLAALAGCATTGGSFEPDGFHQGQFPLAVHYAAPETKDFLGPDWRIDNFYLFDDGTIGSRKTTKAYAGRQVIDLRGDGRLTKLDAFYFDLKLDNRKTSAVIWLQTLPLGRNETDRNLKNLVEDYADDLSGTGFFAAVNDGRALKSKTYAARIVSGADTTLGKLPAYDARLELANLDQIRLDPERADCPHSRGPREDGLQAMDRGRGLAPRGAHARPRRVQREPFGLRCEPAGLRAILEAHRARSAGPAAEPVAVEPLPRVGYGRLRTRRCRS